MRPFPGAVNSLGRVLLVRQGLFAGIVGPDGGLQARAALVAVEVGRRTGIGIVIGHSHAGAAHEQ